MGELNFNQEEESNDQLRSNYYEAFVEEKAAEDEQNREIAEVKAKHASKLYEAGWKVKRLLHQMRVRGLL